MHLYESLKAIFAFFTVLTSESTLLGYLAPASYLHGLLVLHSLIRIKTLLGFLVQVNICLTKVDTRLLHVHVLQISRCVSNYWASWSNMQAQRWNPARTVNTDLFPICLMEILCLTALTVIGSYELNTRRCSLTNFSGFASLKYSTFNFNIRWQSLAFEETQKRFFISVTTHKN